MRLGFGDKVLIAAADGRREEQLASVTVEIVSGLKDSGGGGGGGSGGGGGGGGGGGRRMEASATSEVG